jgi:hypothetical protein
LYKANDELAQLSKEWTAPIYVFFKPDPIIEYIGTHRAHMFQCAVKSCKHKSRGVQRFLDKGDACSTGNLRKHAKKCWGKDVVEAADEDSEVRTTTAQSASNPGSITTAFEWKGKGRVTYSHKQHTTTESRAELVRWVAENNHPFAIVKDRAFQSLMKTGRLGYYIPSPSTLSRDVKLVFLNVRSRIAQMLQVSKQFHSRS